MNENKIKKIEELADKIGISTEELLSLLVEIMEKFSIEEIEQINKKQKEYIANQQKSIREKMRSGARKTHGSLKFPL